MAASIYLAMTAAEISNLSPLPGRICWMACHFSPYGTGLSNLPSALPPDCILMVNDRIPFRGHDINRIGQQLRQAVETLKCSGVLLDLQTPDVPGLRELARHLTSALPCPVAVSEGYAAGLEGPVFLAPCPHHTPLREHIESWTGRELWLDLAVDAEIITLTREGAAIFPLPLGEMPETGHWDENLHCHYITETGEDHARFTLWRTRDDLEALAREAERLGINTLVGLFQECGVRNQECRGRVSRPEVRRAERAKGRV